MKNRAKRLLCLAMAFTMAVSFPIPGMKTQAAVNTTEAKITSPDDGLPENFSKPLEDTNGVTFAEGASTSQVYGCDTVLDVTTHWNNKNEYHASVNNAASYFKTTAFTVFFDVRQDAPTDDKEKVDNRVAMSIGNNTNSLHILTYSGKFGYGSAASGVSANHIDLTGAEQGKWNAVAMTYEENGGNGHVVIYINGQKAGEVADIGFKLSTMNDLSATLARTFGTSYLQQGRYDNLVIGNSVLDAEKIKAVTAARKHAKDNLVDASLISIKGSDVDAAARNRNGLTYKGFGMLNGNSTSNLLLDYKAKAPDAYDEMMQYLFGGDYPLFTHIKMEMGNDGNNSTGAEACTMRYENEDADASRSPGFVMAADAKEINPKVKISILRWEMPTWVADKWKDNTNNQGYEAMYKWYKETIFDAYEKYHYVVDFVNPDKNETGDPDTKFIKWFANRIANETEFPSYMDEAAKTAYKNIRIIASDENKGLKIVPYMRDDAELYEAVDIIGFHYRTNATDDYVTMADVDDKEVWYSEGCATFGYTELQENKTIEYGNKTIGGYQSPLALMDSFITAFDSSRRTHYMFQPAIGSFYEGIQYGHKELLSARDPWSGYIHYDPALYMLEHFAKFAKTGWEGSDPSVNEIWRVISASTNGSFAGSDNEHATAGINGNAGYMTLAAPDKSDFSVVFVNNTQNPKTFYLTTEGMEAAAAKNLNLWVTETDRYLQNKGFAERVDGGWKLTIPAYSVATATTLATTPERTPKEDIHNEDRAVLDTDTTGGTNGVTTDNVLYADNFEYKEEAADFLSARGNEPRYMLDTHGAWVVENGKLKHELNASVAQWNPGDPSTVTGDFRWMDYITSVDIEIPNASADTWARLTIRSQSGMNWDNSGYTLSVNGAGNWMLHRIGTKVAEGSVKADPNGKYKVQFMALGDVISAAINGESVTSWTDDKPMLSGRIKLSSTWNQVYFDNLLVETAPGGIPYALSMVDSQDDCVTYEGTWKIDNPGSGSADNWYRTISTTETANSSFSFPINGCGFSILGSNDGTAKLDIYVDDNRVAENAATVNAPTRGETYMLSGLESGEHTIKVVVKSGKLNIDALYTHGARLAGQEDALVSVKTDNLPSISEILSDGKIENLPSKVEVLTQGGSTVTKSIIWNTSADQFAGKEFVSAFITGTVQDGVNAMGLPLTVSLPVGMVVPSGTLYFIDSVEGTPSANATTEPYAAVKKLLGSQLLNNASDQLKTDNNMWGLVDTGAQTKGYNNDTTDMTATGIYGKENTTGEILSYAFTLPKGSYKVISAHRDWWSKDRPMAASLNYDGKKIDAGTISLTKNNNKLINSKEFTLDSQQLVTYTITSQADQAPVISWLAIVSLEGAGHTHIYTYQDNKDGTHTAACIAGDDSITEEHTYKDNTCEKCGAKKPEEHTHTYTYKDNKDGTHTVTCTAGDDSFTEEHSYKNNVCEKCDAKKPEHTHTYTYKDNKNGTHTGTCTAKDHTFTEKHTFKNKVCTLCGAKESTAPVTLKKPALSSITNTAKGITIKWKKVTNAADYQVYRKTGSGKWSKVKTVKGLSWTDTKTKNGTKYQYRIYAHKGSVKSTASAAKTIYRLVTKNLTSAKNLKGKKLSLKWAKNTKASGYQIQYATNSKFSKAKSKLVTGGKKSSITLTKLKKGKNYWVRIRSYKKVSSKTKCYSAWSKVKKVKIKK